MSSGPMTKHQNQAQGHSPYADAPKSSGTGGTRDPLAKGGHPGHNPHFDDHHHTGHPHKEGSGHHGDHGHKHMHEHHPKHSHGGHVHMHEHHPAHHDGGHGKHPHHGRKK